jgi:NADPH-dependent ferric siderophore reductase
MSAGYGLGRVFNVVQNASGVSIPLTRATGVAFVTFEDDGSTIATMTEVDSTGVESEQALDVDFYPFKGPGVGGTWTAMAEQDDTVDLGDDTANDSMVLHVHAEQLSDGYDSVQCTVDGGVVTAIVYDLTVQRNPANLASSIVA